MTPRLLSNLLILAISSGALAGCEDDPLSLTVYGSVDVTTGDGLETGFRFEQNTSLVDDGVATTEPIAGHCWLEADGGFDVAVVRPDLGEDDQGAIRSLAVQRVGEVTTVTIELGAETYSAEADEVCRLEALTFDHEGGRLNLSLGCTLEGSEGGEAAINVEGGLNFGSCESL